MGWNDIAGNQTVSYANLQDAVNLGLFTLSSALPTPSNKQTTKAVALQHLNGINANYPLFAERLPNQLITKDSIYIGGEFILDPQYGKVITSMTGTGLPTFTYNVTSITTRTYNATVPAQTITVGVDGNAFVTPVKLTLAVDSVLVDQKALVNNGPDSITLTLPVTVASPSSIAIRVSSGTVPSLPDPPALGGLPFTAVSVSRSNGQYMAAGQGRNRNPVTAGYIYTSSDYGATWTQRSRYGYWSAIGHSHNGQYLLAVEQYGKAYRSNDYGVGWFEINNFPAPDPYLTPLTPLQILPFTAVALSSTGQYQVITTNLARYSDGNTYSNIFVSSDFGQTWTSRKVDPYSWDVPYTSVAINGSGNIILVGESNLGMPLTTLYKSVNYGATWSLKGSQGGGNPIGLSITADGVAAIAARFANVPAAPILNQLMVSTNSGENWSIVTQSSPAGLSADYWRRVSVYDNYPASYEAYAITNNTSDTIKRIENLTTVVNITSSLFKDWRDISSSDLGGYALAASTTGLYRTTNKGASWTQVT